MALREYQELMALDTLYPTRLAVISGLGETLSPMIGATGTADLALTFYGAFEEPTGVTLANIATKMFRIKDNVTNLTLEGVPNWMAVVKTAGTITDMVISSVKLETSGTAIPA